MSKVLVLCYSSHGHIEPMAGAVAEGAREAGAQADIKRVPELLPDAVARSSYFKLDQAAPTATVDDLAAYDATLARSSTYTSIRPEGVSIIRKIPKNRDDRARKPQAPPNGPVGLVLAIGFATFGRRL